MKDKLVALGVLAVLLAVLGGVASRHPFSSASFGGMDTQQAQEVPYGSITTASENSITLSSQPPYASQPLTYVLMLTASTTIMRHENKTPAQFQEELKAFQEGHASSSPIGYTSVPANRAQLVPGAVIEAPGATKQADGSWLVTQVIIDIAATSSAR